jgi:hypothetical protein
MTKIWRKERVIKNNKNIYRAWHWYRQVFQSCHTTPKVNIVTGCNMNKTQFVHHFYLHPSSFSPVLCRPFARGISPYHVYSLLLTIKYNFGNKRKVSYIIPQKYEKKQWVLKKKKFEKQMWVRYLWTSSKTADQLSEVIGVTRITCDSSLMELKLLYFNNVRW